MVPTVLQLATKIIKEQELVIGPLAWAEASKVPGINIIDQKTAQISISANENSAGQVIDKLVAQYERLFGRTSHEVCKEAVHDLILGLRPEEIPVSLR